MEYKLIGYDIRAEESKYVNKLWNDEMRRDYLLKDDIAWPMSVDTMLWPSIFIYKNQSEDYKKYSHNNWKLLNDLMIKIDKKFDYGHELLKFWPTINDMKKYFLEKRNTKIKGCPIAVEIGLSDNISNSLAIEVILSNSYINEKKPDEGWDFLGFDIADGYLFSGLMNCGYDENEKKKFVADGWKERINEFGLIKTEDYAKEFCMIANKRIPEHAPFFIYKLYRSPELL